MKQAAVEWLKKELEEYGSSSHLNLDWDTFDELCEQAKEMFEEQLKDAFNAGVNDECLGKNTTPEQYYSETYKK